MLERIDQKKIYKIGALLHRVIRLNEAADKSVYYSLEYSGDVNAVIFAKRERGSYEAVYQMTAYMDQDFGCSLDDIEEMIRTEEQVYADAV